MKNKTSSCTLMRNSVSDAGHLRRPKALALLAFCLLAVSPPGQAQGLPPVSATITFANGGSITISSNDQQVFSPVDILPGEVPGVQLQLPPNFVNTPVGIETMDGGHTPDELQVAEDGSAAFAFQAGTQPGLYRIVLRTADSSVLLQFSVPNSGQP